MPGPLSAFTGHRNLLFTIAYEMLGSAADAEDVVQETWLRWSDVDHDAVREPRAYLASTTARLSLNRLRSLRRRRETYVGQWLPEPVATDEDVSRDVELADATSYAMLVVLESLSPTERAVFVMREVFGFEYREIADAVEKSEDAVRQIASRARTHVRERREHATVTAAEHAAVSERFFRAAADGDVQQLMDVLAPGVVLLSDGGGLKTAVLRPIVGVDKVLRFMDGVRPAEEQLRFETRSVNGAPALVICIDDVLDTLVSTRVRDGRIVEIYVLRNPHKLERITRAIPLRR